MSTFLLQVVALCDAVLVQIHVEQLTEAPSVSVFVLLYQ